MGEDGTVRTVKVREIAEDNSSAVVSGLTLGHAGDSSTGRPSVGDGQKVAVR